MLREQQVEARQLVESVQPRWPPMAICWTPTSASVWTIAERAAGAQELLDVDAVKAAVEALSAATDEFAARRMDRSIRAALAGRKLDEIA